MTEPDPKVVAEIVGKLTEAQVIAIHGESTSLTGKCRSVSPCAPLSRKGISQMFCPETCVLTTRWLHITRHERTDYYRGAPLRERLNPLRYEIGIGRNVMGGTRWRINRDGRWNRKLSDLTWRLWRRRRREREQARREAEWHIERARERLRPLASHKDPQP